MEYEDRHVTATPEGIRLDVVLAGLGSRFAAYAIDFVIQLVALFCFFQVLNYLAGPNPDETSSLLADGAAALFVLVDFMGYFVIAEMLSHGRSPGKQLAGLRVVLVGGQPVGFLGSLLRNVLRIVDFLPIVNVLGSVLILSTSRNQRLGDLAAGTVVIRERLAAERAVSPACRPTGRPAFTAPATCRRDSPTGTSVPCRPRSWLWRGRSSRTGTAIHPKLGNGSPPNSPTGSGRSWRART